MIPVIRNADFLVSSPEGERRTGMLDHLATLNRTLDTGTSDRLYQEAAHSLNRDRMASLLRDFRIGGLSAVSRRLRRAGPRLAGSFLRSLAARLFSRPS